MKTILFTFILGFSLVLHGKDLKKSFVSDLGDPLFKGSSFQGLTSDDILALQSLESTEAGNTLQGVSTDELKAQLVTHVLEAAETYTLISHLELGVATMEKALDQELTSDEIEKLKVEVFKSGAFATTGGVTAAGVLLLGLQQWSSGNWLSKTALILGGAVSAGFSIFKLKDFSGYFRQLKSLEEQHKVELKEELAALKSRLKAAREKVKGIEISEDVQKIIKGEIEGDFIQSYVKRRATAYNLRLSWIQDRIDITQSGLSLSRSEEKWGAAIGTAGFANGAFLLLYMAITKKISPVTGILTPTLMGISYYGFDRANYAQKRQDKLIGFIGELQEIEVDVRSDYEEFIKSLVLEMVSKNTEKTDQE